jgi:hypothetical protein
MNIKAICIASAMMVASDAWSQLPAPNTAKSSEPEQYRAAVPNGGATSSNAAVQQPPIVIKNIFKPEMTTGSGLTEKRHADDESPSKWFLDAVVGLSTLALAGITGWLVYYTRGLYKATVGLSIDAKATSERQATEMKRSFDLAEAANKVARDEFQYVHRPRLTIRRVQIRFEKRDNGINLVLANVGHLSADNITANVNVRIEPIGKVDELTKESLPPYGTNGHDISRLRIQRSPDQSPVLGADERMFLYFIFAEITEASMKLVESRESILFFFGFLEFFGPDGVRRRSAFFREYDAVTKIFKAREDLDYEHH